MDVASLTAEQIYERIRVLMSNYATQHVTPSLNGAFRARKNNTDQEYQNVSELWYPPAHLVLNRGRFNARNTPVFYINSDAQGAIYEVRPQVGEVITVLQCVPKAGAEKIKLAQIGLEKSRAPQLSEGSGVTYSNPRFIKHLKQNKALSGWRQVDGFLSDMATSLWLPEEEQDRYKVTNAILHLLCGAEGVFGLIYPSVATALQCTNICLATEKADEIFSPKQAWMVRVEEEAQATSEIGGSGNIFRTSFLKRSRSIDADGSIDWTDIEPNFPIETLLRKRVQRLSQNPSSRPQ